MSNVAVIFVPSLYFDTATTLIKCLDIIVLCNLHNERHTCLYIYFIHDDFTNITQQNLKLIMSFI